MIYYLTVLLISVLLTIIYIFKWNKSYNTYITIIAILIPIANTGALLMSMSESLEGALMATRISYIGGCYLSFFIINSIFDLCELKVSRWIRVAIFAHCTLLYAFVITAGEGTPFYKHISFSIVDGVPVFEKTYGPLHTVFVISVIAYAIASFVAIIYTGLKKKKVSNHMLRLLYIPQLICLISYLFNKRFGIQIELVNAGYTIALFVFLLISDRLRLYDVEETAAHAMIKGTGTGIILLDNERLYLGSNQAAKEFFPSLRDQEIDKPFADGDVKNTVDDWINDYEQNGRSSLSYETGEGDEERFFKIHISRLRGGVRKHGWQITAVDETKHRKYIALINNYNADLQHEVDEKTLHIVEMHNNLILSMATMVESRDNSTGGHIKRTSEGVRLLIDEMKKDESFDLSDEFCADVVKAAPMHDLGKIAVDDAVLRKPGRFTDEEFAIMKTHAAEGAKIVHEILKLTDDDSFKQVAENVAHYHHERFDGTGYPEGLKGDEIPFEARIMAIADVYDALVSKRVYKESMSFEAADKIIMEGMGKHFDPKLQSCYEAARPHLEAYYSSIDK
ncbi:MAG: HD domain-containing protein [Lachnospiraceae bacterium]|nr:HD domain-containing protein [Lachnospiraceae bacterium]